MKQFFAVKELLCILKNERLKASMKESIKKDLAINKIYKTTIYKYIIIYFAEFVNRLATNLFNRGEVAK